MKKKVNKISSHYQNIGVILNSRFKEKSALNVFLVKYKIFTNSYYFVGEKRNVGAFADM